jgi:hypothetical protein
MQVNAFLNTLDDLRRRCMGELSLHELVWERMMEKWVRLHTLSLFTVASDAENVGEFEEFKWTALYRNLFGNMTAS